MGRFEEALQVFAVMKVSQQVGFVDSDLSSDFAQPF